MSRGNGELAAYLLELGDDVLILGHRLSEWCGHGPTLEEDIALANIALDCLGQAERLLAMAGESEQKNRDADALAFFRDTTEFRNCLLVEQPNGDFAQTIVRELFFATYFQELLGALGGSASSGLREFSLKASKEVRYHLRHAQEWTLRLGDGTDESKARMEQAVATLWRFTPDLFTVSSACSALLPARISADPSLLYPSWLQSISAVLAEAQLARPEPAPALRNSGRAGFHSEHLGHLLAQMQSTARSLPAARW